MSLPPPPAHIELTRTHDTLRLCCSGHWRWQPAPPAQPDETAWTNATRLTLHAEAVREEDGALLAWLLTLCRSAQRHGAAIDSSALPDAVRRLLDLALAVPVREDSRHEESPGFFAGLGMIALRVGSDLPRAARFTGEIVLACLRLASGRARFRLADLISMIEEHGPRALPITSLISFLVGTILAYMGAVQLAQFGAQIYIADLVAIGMVREVGALMTGIILAGRTGAAYAAQIGTMQVNEEVDAYRSLGLPSIDYLVLPRLLALLLTVPLLTLYSGFVGILAGMLVATTVFGVGVNEYFNETLHALSFTHIAIGMFKGTIYGALVAFAGCMRGMQCGRSAQAVGEATTSAVVTSILLITVAASLLTVIFQKLGL